MTIDLARHQITASDGLPISLTIREPDAAMWRGGGRLPLVVLLHGLKGFANWGHFPWVAEQICARGFMTISVDFSRNGVEHFGDEITRVDLAEHNSFSRELDEVARVLAALREGELPDSGRVDPDSVFLLGHSIGGGVALLAAAREPDVRGVVVWAAISAVDFWPDETIAEWKAAGRINRPNARTGQDFWLGAEFLEDVLHPDRLDILEAVRELRRPLLIVHGAEDASVPRVHGERILKASNADHTEMFIVSDGDHTFGAKHPFEGPTPPLQAATAKTVQWLAATAGV